MLEAATGSRRPSRASGAVQLRRDAAPLIGKPDFPLPVVDDGATLPLTRRLSEQATYRCSYRCASRWIVDLLFLDPAIGSRSPILLKGKGHLRVQSFVASRSFFRASTHSKNRRRCDPQGAANLIWSCSPGASSSW